MMNRTKTEFVPYPINKASESSLQRIRDRVPEDELEGTGESDKEEMNSLTDEMSSMDPNFQSTLHYDGYQSIEESDNDAYNSLDAERSEDTEAEITIKDRMNESDMGEEDPVDPQENRK